MTGRQQEAFRDRLEARQEQAHAKRPDGVEAAEQVEPLPAQPVVEEELEALSSAVRRGHLRDRLLVVLGLPGALLLMWAMAQSFRLRF